MLATTPTAASAEPLSTTTSSTTLQPVVLWHADPRRGRVVAAACPRAIRGGVRLGMPLAQATDLAAMTGAVLEPYDRDADRQALQSLAIELQTHLSPQTAVESLQRFKWAGRHRHDPESILAEIQGVTHLFAGHDARQGELGLLSAAAKILGNRNLIARMAIADTLGTAWALANHAVSQSQVITAENKHKNSEHDNRDTHQFFIAPPGGCIAALQTLPCAALRLHPDVIHTLDRLGVSTIGKLLQLPRDGLATRLGTPLCDRIAEATGEVEESIIAIASQCEHAATLELEYPTDAIDLLADRIARLIHDATAGLHPLKRGVLRLQCRLEFSQHPPLVLETGLFAPTLDGSYLTSLMIGALEASRLVSEVTRISLGVLQHAALSSRQPSIFGPDFTASAHDDWTLQTEAARLIDALSGRLGEEAVRGVRVSDDPLPENAIVDFPMTAHRLKTQTKKAQRNSRALTAKQQAAAAADAFDVASPASSPRTLGFGHGPQTTDLGRRPIELLKKPLPITPVAVTCERTAHGSVPATINSLPDHFRIRGQLERVTRHWGPERIETRWWSGPLIRRDYYRIELENGSRLWIYCDLGDGTPTATEQAKTWFMHGSFA